MSGVRISRSLLDAIRAHAAEEPTREVCGLLLGEPGWISEARRAPNVAESPADSFEIDPAALFAAIRAERAGGPKLLGHYHSHPVGRAEPSKRDVMMARDGGRLWLILAASEARLWTATTDGSLEEALLIQG